MKKAEWTVFLLLIAKIVTEVTEDAIAPVLTFCIPWQHQLRHLPQSYQHPSAEHPR